MAFNPVLSWDKAGFLLLYAGVFRDLANFAKLHKKITAIEQ